MSDREYAKYTELPGWLKEFADKELKKEGNPFDDIRELFNMKKEVEAVESKVKELRDRVGLDKITKESADKLPGGLADGKSDKDFDSEQLEKGIKIELEHTKDKELAKEIAKDHLMESHKYYDYLEEMEEKMEKSLPDIFEKYPKFQNMIDDIVSSRGGHVDVPAVLEIIIDSKTSKKENIKFSQKDRQELKEYIQKCKSSIKQDFTEEDNTGVVVFVIDETFDDNNDIFK